MTALLSPFTCMPGCCLTRPEPPCQRCKASSTDQIGKDLSFSQAIPPPAFGGHLPLPALETSEVDEGLSLLSANLMHYVGSTLPAPLPRALPAPLHLQLAETANDNAQSQLLSKQAELERARQERQRMELEEARIAREVQLAQHIVGAAAHAVVASRRQLGLTVPDQLAMLPQDYAAVVHLHTRQNRPPQVQSQSPPLHPFVFNQPHGKHPAIHMFPAFHQQLQPPANQYQAAQQPQQQPTQPTQLQAGTPALDGAQRPSMPPALCALTDPGTAVPGFRQRASSQAANPQAAKCKAVNPQAATPQAAHAQATNPQNATPQAATLQAANAQAANPQAANPQAANPQAANPQAAAGGADGSAAQTKEDSHIQCHPRPACTQQPWCCPQ